MKIGIGLPNSVLGAPGDRLVEWGIRAEQHGFTGLATIDRINYPSHDSLAALAAVAGTTSRIELLTNILLAPAYPPVLLAKTAATIDRVSGGRLTLGLAPGGRPDDFDLVEVDFHRRGAQFDSSLETMHRAWRGESLTEGEMAVTPEPVTDARVPILVGGSSEATLRRLTEWGAGWTVGGSTPEMAAPFADRVRAAWKDSGRSGEPRMAALAYFSLGDEVVEESKANLKHYYAFLGEYADMIADGALRSAQAVRDAVKGFEDIGITELYFDPSTSSVDQVDRLADIVL